jgi:hypothetical protein
MSRRASRAKIKVAFYFFILSGWLFLFTAQAGAQGPSQAKADTGPEIFKSEVSYQAENLRDPFINPIKDEISPRPDEVDPNAALAPFPAMKVQGIFWGGKFPQAIINDKIVKVGETIEGAQVVSIEKDLVRVFFINKEYALSSPASDNLASSSNKKEVKKEGFNEKSF